MTGHGSTSLTCKQVNIHQNGGHTVNKEYYLAVSNRSREKIRQKRTDLWKKNLSILRDDNAPSHGATVVTEFKAKNATNTINYPPYTLDPRLDLASCDFFLFLKLKLPLWGTRFDLIEAIK